MDLIDDDTPSPGGPKGGNAHEYTVSDLSGAVKRTLEGEFGRVRVRGEVGRVTIARTGHMYFDLKDDRATISAVSWKGQVAKMAVRPEEGMEVIATGRLTTFAPQSRYQLQVETVEPAGAGALMAMLEARKKALAAEGLFDPARKRPIPYLPRVIGVITSAQGAVIRDILHRLADRFPRHVIVWPVAVQGERCPRDVVRAIEGFNALPPGGPIPRPDLLIVARGGGSIEDLWGFNDESVARAAAASQIPLISAVGHETDTTLIDYASDLRAPTPTAAAEMAVPVRADLLAQTADLGARLQRATRGRTQDRQQRLRDLARALPRADAVLATPQQRLDRATDRFGGSLRQLANRKALDLNRAASGLRPARLRDLMDSRAARLTTAAQRLTPALTLGLDRRADRLRGQRLRAKPLTDAVATHRRDLTRLHTNATRAAARRATQASDALRTLARMLDTLGPYQTLARGYAIIRDPDGTPLTSAEAVRAQPHLTLTLKDGEVTATPLGSPPAKPKRKDTPPPPADQGSLF